MSQCAQLDCSSCYLHKQDDFFFLVYSQVSVALSSGSIRVAMLEENGERVLMEGKLTHKINTESSLWSLEPGKCVLVSVVTVCRALRCVSNLL